MTDAAVLDLTDPVALAQALVRCPSVTPAEAGALDLLGGWLERLGFTVRRLPFGEVDNLYARRGPGRPNLCFAGHTDVVPPGDAAAWRTGPFAGTVADGTLTGRGVVDMKGAIACWVAAVARAGATPCDLSLLITGDEEGPAVDGTGRVVGRLLEEGERLDACVLGEPTSAAAVGDQLKIGRRGSLNAWITVTGVQGHVAYPDKAANPLPPLLALLSRLTARVLDEGHERFPASNLEVTTVDVGNPATNVIPAEATARLNIRFNPHHTGAGLIAWLEAEVAAADAAFPGGRVRLRTALTGDAFLTEPGPFTTLLGDAAAAVTGRAPALSTTGGISDARFLRTLCPVVELGLVGATMHMANEHAPLADLETLTRIYAEVIGRFGAAPQA